MLTVYRFNKFHKENYHKPAFLEQFLQFLTGWFQNKFLQQYVRDAMTMWKTSNTSYGGINKSQKDMKQISN
jgi:hypothetical protein